MFSLRSKPSRVRFPTFYCHFSLQYTLPCALTGDSGGIDQGFHPCLLVLSHSHLFAKNISPKCFLYAQSPLGFDFLHATVTLACNLHCFVLSLVTRGGIEPPLPA